MSGLPSRASDDLRIRRLSDADPQPISDAFASIGGGKPATKYRNYLVQQAAGTRVCLVAELDHRFAGYVTLNWAPSYPAFAETKLPEIQDLNVLPDFRRQGIATRLLDDAELIAAERSCSVGIGVGLHPGYNAAQRLYVKRGYVPDGRGVTYRNRYVQEGETVKLDDDFVLYLIKQLR
jgi:GNAT superfamily N-acetyltransferase